MSSKFITKSPKTVLVTGCAGFIGSNFTRQFGRQFPETKIVGIDNFVTGRKDAVDPKIVFCRGSLLDERFLKKIFTRHRPEYVFHFAATPRVSYSVEHPSETMENNVVGTVRLMETAKNFGAKRLIYSSSSSVYGGAKKLPTTESGNFPDPQSPYALQKYIGEPLGRIFSELYGLDTVSLRYFNVFGPGQYGDSAYSTVISAWLEALYYPGKRRRPFLEDDGEQSRDFCYVDNVVAANILAMRYRGHFAGDVFNIAHGERTTVNQVRKLIEKYSGRRLELEKRPPRLGDIRHTHADISKAKKWFGYRPLVNFEEGLKRTIAWFEGRRNGNKIR